MQSAIPETYLEKKKMAGNSQYTIFHFKMLLLDVSFITSVIKVIDL